MKRLGKLSIGFRPLAIEAVRALGLDGAWEWEEFCIDWGSGGLTIFVRPTRYRFPFHHAGAR